jgi:putative protease
VQDPAVCLLARARVPELELHASTQMTISSAERRAFARSLGVTRVVVPRELSVAEIAQFAAAPTSSSRSSSTARCACRGAGSA